MTEQIKTHNFGMGWGKILMNLFASCLCGGVLADTWSASPSSAWDTSNPTKVVFNSASDGTLDSTTDTQSTATSVGLSGTVSLEKRGTGTLTVNGMHSFTGNIGIYEGTYRVGSGTTDKGAARNSQLGDPRTVRKITVYTNATLRLARTGVFGAGTAGSDILADVEIRGGTLTLPTQSCTTFGNLLFHNATINGNTGHNAHWPAFCLTGDWMEFSSDTATPYDIPACDNGGFFMSRVKPVDIRVPDITGDANPDVTFAAVISDGWYDPKYNSGHNIPYNWGNWTANYSNDTWRCTTNFVKTGEGTMAINSMDNTFRRDVVVSNGTLRLLAHQARAGENIKTCLGLSHVPHTIYVEPGARLEFTQSDHLGQFYNVPTGITIHVRGGTLTQSANKVNGLGPLILEDATLSYSGTTGGWPTLGFSDVTFKGSKAYTLAQASSSYFAIGMNGMANLRVEKIVSYGTYPSSPDVTISSPIKDSTNVWQGYGPRKSTFRKTGPGVLRLASTSSEFTGDVEISEGVVTLGRKGPGINLTSSSLGNMMADRTITICGTGELYFDNSDVFSQACSDYGATMVVSNGTMRFKSGTVNPWPTVKFYDANLVYGGGSGYSNTGDASAWGMWAFRYPVTFDGTKPLSLPSNGSYCIMSLGYSSDSRQEIVGDLTNYYGKTEFCVKDMTGNPCVDVDIGMKIQSLPFWNYSGTANLYYRRRYRCGLLKTGPGTLRIGGTFTCPENTRINEGALVFDGTLAEQNSGWGKSAMQVQAGAYLGGTGTVQNVTIEEGGGFTSAIGQTGALEINGTVTLPSSGNVPLNIVCTNDLETLVSYRTPIVKSSKLGGARFVPVFNGGAALPPNLGLTVSEQNGVIYGIISRKGMTIIFK